MIKNIIFDMGKVLIDFDPLTFIKREGISDKNDIEIILREIYKSVEWSMMDRGSLTEEEASKIMEKRVPDHLKAYVKKLTYNWDRPIIPIVGAKDLVKELKENGYNLYLLSNAGYKQKEYWPRVPGSEYFDGTVISSYIKLVKPELEIYRYTLDKFNLKKEECVFIDDSTLNVEGAIYLGLKGIVFHGDFNEVREKLIELGVNVKKIGSIKLNGVAILLNPVLFNSSCYFLVWY